MPGCQDARCQRIQAHLPASAGAEGLERRDVLRRRAAAAAEDGRVRRQQVERARDLTEFITIVRTDEYASDPLKTDYLLSIPDVAVTPDLAEQILSLSPQEWQRAVEEIPANVVERGCSRFAGNLREAERQFL